MKTNKKRSIAKGELGNSKLDCALDKRIRIKNMAMKSRLKMKRSATSGKKQET